MRKRLRIRTVALSWRTASTMGITGFAFLPCLKIVGFLPRDAFCPADKRLAFACADTVSLNDGKIPGQMSSFNQTLPRSRRPEPAAAPPVIGEALSRRQSSVARAGGKPTGAFSHRKSRRDAPLTSLRPARKTDVTAR